MGYFYISRITKKYAKIAYFLYKIKTSHDIKNILLTKTSGR